MEKAEFLEKLADVAGVVVDAEALGDDLLEIDPPVAGQFGVRFWIACFQWLGVVPETSAWTFNLRFLLPLDI